MLDVRRLRVLREVARRGSFSAAADALAFTQPAVSRQIATLEAEAGAQLVERTARGIRLTPAGELLVEHAEMILDRLALAETQLEALAGLQGGRLRLGVFPTANATLIPLAIAAFAAEHPDVELRLTEAPSSELVGMLAAGEIDLAVLSDAESGLIVGPGGELRGGDEAEFEPLMDDRLYLALPRAHPLAERTDLRMEDLRDESWIEGRDSVCHGPLVAAAQAAGFEPRIVFESAQWLGKQGLVAAGIGVTLIPQVALATVRDDIVLRSLGPDGPRRQIYLGTQCCGYQAPAVEPMKAILRRVAEEHCFSCEAIVDSPLATAAL